MIEHRRMKAGEMEELFDLWVEVYPGTERERWKQEYLSVPGSVEHTFVAIDGGRIYSTALLWVREMNDAVGTSQRVGNVSHVATHPHVRGGGRLYLPADPDITALLHQFLNPLSQIESNELMVRPVNPQKAIGDFMINRSNRAGIFWLLDQI